MKNFIFMGAIGLLLASCTTTISHTVTVNGQVYLVEEEVTEDLRTGEKTYEFSVPVLGLSCASVGECREKIEELLKEMEKSKTPAKPAASTPAPRTGGASDVQGD